MIKKHLPLLIITSIVILLPILVGLLLWNQLPDALPIHWNAEGEVDGYSSKPFAVFAMPLILLAVHWLAAVVTQTDPKKQNQSEKVKILVFWLIPAISLLVNLFTYSAALGKSLRVETVMPIFMGLLFMAIGNYLPKCKQNYTVGIKLPWTLHSEENWNRTHRLAGWLWVGSGLLCAVAGFFGAFLLTVPVLLVMALVPMIYSYALYKKGV
jgi:uncharacterized membrane protein